MVTVVVEGYSQQDRLVRLQELFFRYKARTVQGVEDGHLFFNPDQVVDHARKMAAWHLKQEEQAALGAQEADRRKEIIHTRRKLATRCRRKTVQTAFGLT